MSLYYNIPMKHIILIRTKARNQSRKTKKKKFHSQYNVSQIVSQF